MDENGDDFELQESIEQLVSETEDLEDALQYAGDLASEHGYHDVEEIKRRIREQWKLME